MRVSSPLTRVILSGSLVAIIDLPSLESLRSPNHRITSFTSPLWEMTSTSQSYSILNRSAPGATSTQRLGETSRSLSTRDSGGSYSSNLTVRLPPLLLLGAKNTRSTSETFSLNPGSLRRS